MLTYSLQVLETDENDKGGFSRITYVENGKTVHKDDARPIVGATLRVGTQFTRNHTAQDWIQTDTILEILSESDCVVKFKTANNTYIWTKA